ncbi:Epidermal differentiation-specific protein [Orchesella cincta]|uniref:Epidermal differentiation-specific protein n=1 Tax=Orchesella cincta TaxID=48709 RepID=A0A1D2MND9_ORCCI|nr:Epidermal differentiation-specific protein [Orchesella cincta]
MSLLPTIFHVIFSYIVIGLMRFATVDAAPIVLFEDAQFKGINSTFQIGESTCVNLVGKLNDFYSSVDSMGVCFLLCEHVNCRGKCEKVGGKLRDLSNIGLNDLVSSLSLCDDGDDDATAANQDHQDVQPDTPSTTTTTTSTRIFRRRSISTTITAPSRNRKRTKATRSTARKTRTRKSRKLTQITLPSLSPSTA